MGNNKYEVVVAGSGVGGLCSAALLARYGYKVLLVEALERLGGRFSTIEQEGFKTPVGAVVLPTREGPLAETFKEVGVPLELRELGPPSIWIEGEWHQLPEKGQIRALLAILDKIGADKAKIMGHLARQAVTEKITGAFSRDRASIDPSNLLSVRDWLKQYTDDERVLQVFHTITSSYTTVNDYEYPVSHFFAYVSSSGQGGLRHAGIAPRGNTELANSLGAVVKSRGGDVWTGCPVEQIIIQQGKVTGVVVNKDGCQVEVATGVLISDIGHKETIKLTDRGHFDADYLKRVDGLLTAPIVATLVTSDRPLTDAPGACMISGAQRIVIVAPLTNHCPELAPPGQHLMVAWGTPASSRHHIDKEEEARLNLEDIRMVFPDFDKYGRVLRMDLRDIDDDFPGLRSWMGYDMPQETPVPNLFLAGDGAKPFGWEGAPSCAQGARLVVNMVRKRFKLGQML